MNRTDKNSERSGIKGWVDRNKKWIEPGIVSALFFTGNWEIGTIMLILWIVDTM